MAYANGAETAYRQENTTSSSSSIQPAHLAFLAAAYFLIVDANIAAAALLAAIGLAVNGMNYGSTSSLPAPQEERTLVESNRAYSF